MLPYLLTTALLGRGSLALCSVGGSGFLKTKGLPEMAEDRLYWTLVTFRLGSTGLLDGYEGG